MYKDFHSKYDDLKSQNMNQISDLKKEVSRLDQRASQSEKSHMMTHLNDTLKNRPMAQIVLWEICWLLL